MTFVQRIVVGFLQKASNMQCLMNDVIYIYIWPKLFLDVCHLFQRNQFDIISELFTLN